MPIYAYKCESCGHAKDVLQKISDDPLTDCPACGAPRFRKQLTAAGFQLKGSGWYVTDFRNNGGGAVAAASGAAATAATDTASSSAPPASESAGASSASASSASATPCGGACACH